MSRIVPIGCVVALPAKGRAARTLAASIVSGLIAIAPAQATVITQTFHIYATNFGGGVPAVDPVNGDVTITFDPAKLSIFDQTTGITISNFNEPYTGVLNFDYDYPDDRLTINTSNGSCSYGNGYFCFEVYHASATPTAGVFFDSAGATANTFRVTPASISASVPEPSSWLMMIGGFGLMGVALRQRSAAVRFG